MRVIDERGLVWDESPYLAHHGIMGMHWGIRRYQPYPGDYHGDGRYVGKRKEIKNALKEAKKEYKERKIVAKERYKSAKDKNYDAYVKFKEAEHEAQITNAVAGAAREQLRQEKVVLKEDIKQYKDRKKFGSVEEEREAKKLVVGLKDQIEVSKIMVEKALIDQRHSQKSLDEAKRNLDKTKIEVRVQKALYKENKKLAKQRLNEIKQQLKEEEKKVIDGYTREQIDTEKKRLGNDVYGSKANKYADKYPDVRKAKMEFDKRSDQVAKELEKKYPPNSEKSRRAGFDDPDTFWNEIKKDKELQRLEKEYHDTLRKHNVSDRQAVKSLKMASRASSMRASGMSYAQIAKKLGIPESSVSYYLNI